MGRIVSLRQRLNECASRTSDCWRRSCKATGSSTSCTGRRAASGPKEATANAPPPPPRSSAATSAVTCFGWCSSTLAAAHKPRSMATAKTFLLNLGSSLRSGLLGVGWIAAGSGPACLCGHLFRISRPDCFRRQYSHGLPPVGCKKVLMNQPLVTEKAPLSDSVREALAVSLRGCEELIPQDDWQRKLVRSEATGVPLRIKFGLDPTAPDIHLGHTVVFNKMRQLQQ